VSFEQRPVASLRCIFAFAILAFALAFCFLPCVDPHVRETSRSDAGIILPVVNLAREHFCCARYMPHRDSRIAAFVLYERFCQIAMHRHQIILSCKESACNTVAAFN